MYQIVNKRFFFVNARILGLLLAAAWTLASCAASNPSLNSERIERTFGNYGVDIIESNAQRRVSSLFSNTNGQKVTRTYAVVDFIRVPGDAFGREHALIESGQSIGTTFRDGGWSINKQHLFIGELEVPASYLTIANRMRIELPEVLATHVYLFVAEKDERSYTYATITEVHHPAYLTANDLKRLYGEIVFDDSNRDSLADFIGPPIG